MGPSQQQQQQQLANVVSKVTQIQEELVEQEIEKYDSICSSNNNTNNHHSDSNTNTDPVLQEWRQKRMLEYQQRQQELIQCRQTYGHGEYMELGHGTNQNTIDMAQEFFQICKASARVIIHCYRPTTELCHTFHTHLQSLSRKHIETRFIKFNVQDYGEEDTTTTTTRRGATDNTAMKFLIEKLQIRVMPTLILIQNQQIVHRMEGCTELNPTTTQFSTNMLAYVLGHKYHMIYPTPEEISDPVPSTSVSQHSTTKHYKSQYLTGSKGVATRYRYHHNDDEDDDYEDF